jgi:hypothetical protein
MVACSELVCTRSYVEVLLGETEENYDIYQYGLYDNAVSETRVLAT